MSLLEKYNGATTGNAFISRTKQNGDPKIDRDSIVNFTDAGARTTSTDSFQTEFRRQVPGTKEYTPSADTTSYDQTTQKGLSRWYGRALNYAFTDPVAPNNYIQDSVWNTYKGIRPSTKESWTDNPQYFHRYTPTVKFEISTTLSALAQKRAASKSKRV